MKSETSANPALKAGGSGVDPSASFEATAKRGGRPSCASGAEVKKRPSKKAQRRTSYTPAPAQPRVPFRRYQLPAFTDRTTPILILEWSRQIGKSYTLAAWAVDRLLTRPGRLVTVLSNSKDNGAEFARKCCDIARELQAAYALDDLSPDEAGKPAAQIDRKSVV